MIREMVKRYVSWLATETETLFLTIGKISPSRGSEEIAR